MRVRGWNRNLSRARNDVLAELDAVGRDGDGGVFFRLRATEGRGDRYLRIEASRAELMEMLGRAVATLPAEGGSQ